MSQVFDLLLDDDLDLRMERGDLVVGESTLQHQALLLLTSPADWREHPTVGISLKTFLLDDASATELRKEIRKGLEADGMRVDRIEVIDGLPAIEGIYE